jgi:hypothetical protein
VKPLELADLVPADAWEALRPRYREALLAHKRDRRVAVGDRVTLVFEDRETLRWQIQEMARVERLDQAAQLQQELDVYNELVPGGDELSATLFIEITEAPAIRPELDRLLGLDEHVALVLGSGDGALVCPARFDAKQLDEERISAVHYLRFPLPPEAAQRLADPGATASLRITHPHYPAEAELAAVTRRSLARDLAGGVGPLVPLEGGASPPPAPEVLDEGVAIRTVRPARPLAPGHRILEARDTELRLADASSDVLAELADALRRHAAAVTAEHGGCQLRADLHGPLRWHLLGRSPS